MASRFCAVGRSIPRRGNRFSRAVARLLFSWAGWRFEGEIPDLTKAVLIVAPHTSNWDFLVGITAVFALGIRASFLGKHTLFRQPLGWLMRWLGGLPVDRRASSGVVEQTATLIREADTLLLGMSPEGTRGQVGRWKTGFYHIARSAAVPILPISFDFSRRVIGLGTPFMPSGDAERDISELQAFFTGVMGRRAMFTVQHSDQGDTGEAGHIIAALRAAARNHPRLPALRLLENGAWQSTDWQGYHDQAMMAARGLIDLGLEAGDGLVILGANRPEWFLADLAAIAAGALPAGIYTTSTADQCAYIVRHCAARVAVVEDCSCLGKLALAQDQLRAIVLMRGAADSDDKRVLSWQQLLERGRRVDDGLLEQRIGQLQAGDPCSLIYTSGTTGSPKGVLLSHTNVLWMSRVLVRAYAVTSQDRAVSYLPLSHIAEQVLSLYVPLLCGGCVSFAERIDSLGDCLRQVRPTFFFAVPRILEKIQARLEAVAASRGWLARKLLAWARDRGMAAGLAQQRGEPAPLGSAMADRLVLRRVRSQLGLDQARFCFTAAAPISRATLEFFLSLGIPFLEAYGLSECTGPATFSLPRRFRIGAAGFALPGTELRIAGDGEILVRGPHVFLGYHRDPELSREALDGDGWLHTGDIGSLDSDGFLSVTDRKKELIITSGGKNVAPVPIETMLRSIPAVSEAVVVGEGRSYLTALLTLDPERIPAIAGSIGSSVRDAVAAVSCAAFRRYLEGQVERINATLAPYETIKRFAVLPEQLSVESGCLTPTLKLKRRLIDQRYAQEIDALYG